MQANEGAADEAFRTCQVGGLPQKTVRFYEQRGLLPAPPRTAAGHRFYRQEHARRLRFIVRARELGFSLVQIRELLRLSDDGGSVACAEAKTLTLGRLDDIRRKMADLGQLEQALSYMVAQCDAGTRGCPIINLLSERTSAD